MAARRTQTIERKLANDGVRPVIFHRRVALWRSIERKQALTDVVNARRSASAGSARSDR
jgi:hypothetical protein